MEHRFHFFPEPFPDETLHSVLSRYVRLSGLFGSAQVVSLPPWKGRFSDNVPFPCRLNELENALPPGTGLTVKRMIEGHTLLPYYQPFLSERQLRQACHQMEYGPGTGLKLSMGLIASRLEHASCARICPDCIAQDQTNVGVAYWHRAHQLPGVYVCPYHDTPLMYLEHRSFSQFSRRLMLPGDEAVLSCSCAFQIPPVQRQRLLELATSSNTLLQSLVPPLDPSGLRNSLMKATVNSGLASVPHRLRLSDLASFIESYMVLLPDSGEYRVLADHISGFAPTWVTKLLRKPRHSHHPLKYLVLANALRLDIRYLLDAASGPQACLTLSSPISGPLPSQGKKLCSQIPPCRHPRLNGLTDLAQLMWKDAEEGMNAREMAVKHAVSLATVYRAIRTAPDGPKRWEASRFERQLGLRRERFLLQYLNCFAHDCTDYAWLYRNDRNWLVERCDLKSSRGSGRVRSSVFLGLDPTLAADIHNCAQRLFTMPGKPVWVNRSRIGRELGSVARFEKQLDKLPMCAAALRRVCETRHQFHCRRIDWAEHQLLQDGLRASTSQVYRLASIRKQ